jgi:hypothetical protein
MSILLKKLEEAEKLPIGHIGKREASAAVSRVYGKSREIERIWSKRFRRNNVNTKVDEKSATELCLKLCKLTGTIPIKRIVFNSQDVHEFASAHYKRGEIHVKFWFDFYVIIHELTHHVENRDHRHGELFCWTENYLFALAYELLSGKKIKPDWEV